MPLALGACIEALRTTSKEQVTDLPEPTGPMSTRILALLCMNRAPVGGGV
jgi:hypothetical protein